jgi:hypothetical protein
VKDECQTVGKAMTTGYRIARPYQIDSESQISLIQAAQAAEEVPRLFQVPDFSAIIDTITELDMDIELNNLRNQYLGGIRFIQKYAATLEDYAEKVHDFLIKKSQAAIAGKRLRDQDPRTALAHTEAVVDSLPRNVAVNDQLTPIRSQVEANEAFVPDYVTDDGTGDVNFATDSNTVIAIYIAINYPNLSDAQVDEWVDRVIRWRNPSDEEIEEYPGLEGTIPNPHGKSREDTTEFSEWFKQRLTQLNG